MLCNQLYEQPKKEFWNTQFMDGLKVKGWEGTPVISQARVTLIDFEQRVPRTCLLQLEIVLLHWCTTEDLAICERIFSFVAKLQRRQDCILLCFG